MPSSKCYQDGIGLTRRATDAVQARELYADYAYWQWNLEQVAQQMRSGICQRFR